MNIEKGPLTADISPETTPEYYEFFGEVEAKELFKKSNKKGLRGELASKGYWLIAESLATPIIIQVIERAIKELS